MRWLRPNHQFCCSLKFLQKTLLTLMLKCKALWSVNIVKILYIYKLIPNSENSEKWRCIGKSQVKFSLQSRSLDCEFKKKLLHKNWGRLWTVLSINIHRLPLHSIVSYSCIHLEEMLDEDLVSSDRWVLYNLCKLSIHPWFIVQRVGHVQCVWCCGGVRSVWGLPG